MSDPIDLQRFVDAQQPVYAQVCAELRAGNKRSHWMWFVFPQIQGLGHSAIARKFALSGASEAIAYLQHSVLGPRLLECSALVLAVDGPNIGRSIEDIFGYPDYLKFRSCMTLFAHADPGNQVFDACLRKYFDGKPDPETLARL
ncbi:DUF1810 domain-containing protein [Undibacterium arcticum]|uniref:DUF1810 domain-containing protein n=1 Tax=Undibacterium arcticum TaxID=1762892 RepID=A0ABV7EXR5_9BURK